MASQRLSSLGTILLTACTSIAVIQGMPETDLRSLLLLEPNQELIDHLGTRYEIVYPHQIRKDWGAKGLSTALSSVNGTTTHIQETTLIIETLEYKLILDLELNSKLFPPTLIQLLYSKDDSPVTVQKETNTIYMVLMNSTDTFRGVIAGIKRMKFAIEHGVANHLLIHKYRLTITVNCVLRFIYQRSYWSGGTITRTFHKFEPIREPKYFASSRKLLLPSHYTELSGSEGRFPDLPWHQELTTKDCYAEGIDYSLRGVIYLENRIFFLHPLFGNYSIKPPHFLFHYFPEDRLRCGNAEQDDTEDEDLSEDDVLWQRSKYVEMALIFDQSLLRLFKSPHTDALAAALEIVNHVDLLYRRLKTTVSLVYAEFWTEDPMEVVGRNLSDVLESLKEYAEKKISRISVDATQLLTGASFDPQSDGLAFLDSICTSNALGVTRMTNPMKPHVTAFVLAHMLGHNLGMGHDSAGCKCTEKENCLMDGNAKILDSADFSSCSVGDYRRTLQKGYGACLYNMPTLRMSICGNNILEENEQCDCGTAEECARTNPCCDSTTCRLIKHAQCSSGPCCRKCKLLSPDHLCRPSKGECDIPEFCDGDSGECPLDVFKKNGAVCGDGLGYCYQGACPVLKKQCEDIWGKDADVADSICFERLNIQGTPNGNCGRDERGEIAKCTEENSYCGFLQCSQGEKTPLSPDNPPIHFVVHKINFQGTIYECKARTYSDTDIREGLVKEGTKCGYQKLCINQTCTSLKSLVSGRCPEDCSSHGICTNVNSCFCDEGWKGEDCSLIDEDTVRETLYYDAVEGGREVYENTYYGENEMRVNPNLAITVIAASVVIGLGLVVIIILLFYYRERKSCLGDLCHFGSYRCKNKNQEMYS